MKPGKRSSSGKVVLTFDLLITPLAYDRPNFGVETAHPHHPAPSGLPPLLLLFSDWASSDRWMASLKGPPERNCPLLKTMRHDDERRLLLDSRFREEDCR